MRGTRGGRGRGRGRGVHRASTEAETAEEANGDDSDEEDEESGARGYACGKCGKRYTYYVWLKRHRVRCRDHAVFQCVMCDRKFHLSGVFKHHVMSKHGCEGKDVMLFRKAQE